MGKVTILKVPSGCSVARATNQPVDNLLKVFEGHILGLHGYLVKFQPRAEYWELLLAEICRSKRADALMTV